MNIKASPLHNDYDSDKKMLSPGWWYVDESQQPEWILPNIFNQAITDFGYSILQYNDSKWLQELRREFIDWIPRFYHIPDFNSEHLLITNGTTASIDLISRMLLDRKYDAATFEPCYDTAMRSLMQNAHSVVSFKVNDAHLWQLKITEDTWLDLESNFQKWNIKVFYVVPHFWNPTGMSLNLPDRKRLLSICQRYGVKIIEDDPYRLFNYGTSEDVFPSLYELDKDRETVFYANSVSKVGFPGLRIGYIIGPENDISKLTELQKYSTSSPNLISQAMVAIMVKTRVFDQILAERITTMQSKFVTTIDFLIRNGIDKRMQIEIPRGWFFIWGQVQNERIFVEHAKNNGLIVIPWSIYGNENNFSAFTRLTFSQISEASLDEALVRLRDTLGQVWI